MITTRRLLVLLAAALVLAPAAFLMMTAVGKMNTAGPRLVILYATCTLNRDHLSPYNPNISFTPHLEQFANEGVTFTSHYTESGQSGIAFASIFTGTQAWAHGVYRHPTAIARDRYLISEAYADAGWETFFWNAHRMASRGLGYSQGTSASSTYSRIISGSDPAFIEILAKLRKDDELRVFILVNFHMTHGVYRTINLQSFLRQYPGEAKKIRKEELAKCIGPLRSKECNQVFLKNDIELRFDFSKTVEALQLSATDVEALVTLEELIYDSNVNYLDQYFGALIEQLSHYELLDESLVAVTADHGETLHRENALFRWTHGWALAPEVLKVPLIIRSPASGLRPGKYESVTRSIDVFPTLLGLSGIALPGDRGLEGTDLSPALLGAEEPPRLRAFSHTSIPVSSLLRKGRYMNTMLGRLFPTDDVNEMWVSVSDEKTTYKWRNLDGESWGFEAFDKASDPMETTNLFDDENVDHQRIGKMLRTYKERLATAYLEGPAKQPLDDEKVRLLRSLGYIQ